MKCEKMEFSKYGTIDFWVMNPGNSSADVRGHRRLGISTLIFYLLQEIKQLGPSKSQCLSFWFFGFYWWVVVFLM